MRRLLLILTVLVALVLAASAVAAPTIYVSNNSDTVSNSDVAAALPGFQASIDLDVGPAWNVAAKLVFIGAEAAPADAWSLTITDNAPLCFCYGFHDLEGDTPVGFVFPGDGAEGDWQLTLSHELDEMLVDPYVDRAVRGPKRFWLVEVADPVESARYTYTRLGVRLSDFVTPAWYRAGASRPFDHMGVVSRPFQIKPDGYASYWGSGDWRQVQR
jgi:hypothetical protein